MPVSCPGDSRHNSRAAHPGWRRCSSLTNCRFARSSRLAIRARRCATSATTHPDRTPAGADPRRIGPCAQLIASRSHDRRGDIEPPPPPEARCANCGAALHGPFCAACGQAVKPLDPPVTALRRRVRTGTPRRRQPRAALVAPAVPHARLPDAGDFAGRRVPWVTPLQALPDRQRRVASASWR